MTSGELIDALKSGIVLKKDYGSSGVEWVFMQNNRTEIRGWKSSSGSYSKRILDIVNNPGNWQSTGLHIDSMSTFPWDDTNVTAEPVYNGVPADLKEAFELLKQQADSVALYEWASLSESECMFGIHFGSGMDLRNKWGLWGIGENKSPIFKWFNTIGISMGDDISSIIYTSFHRHLNDIDIDLVGQIKTYWWHWVMWECDEYLPPNIEGVSDQYMQLWYTFKRELDDFVF